MAGQRQGENRRLKPAEKPGRLSLYGMTPEDALRRALSTPPPPPKTSQASKPAGKGKAKKPNKPTAK